MRSKLEAQIEEARKWIKLIDEETDDNPLNRKPPVWLKITDKLKYYIEWKYVKWEKGIGWYWGSERIMIDA